MRAVEELLRLAPDAYDITLVVLGENRAAGLRFEDGSELGAGPLRRRRHLEMP